MISIFEVLDVVIMSVMIGYLLNGLFPRPRAPDHFLKNVTPGFHLERLSNFWYTVLLVAPAIVLHELGHKFTAMSFGAEATFHAACSVQNALAGQLLTGPCMLMLGMMGLKFIGINLFFFVPAYVSIPVALPVWQDFLISIAGPLINGLCWIGAYAFIKYAKKPTQEQVRFAALFKRINGFFFIFNLIPIPGFDGYHAVRSLIMMF